MINITCFTFKEKHSCSIFTSFVCRFLSTIILFVFGKAFTLVSKYSVLDAEGVLSPSQYALMWIAYSNNLIQAVDER